MLSIIFTSPFFTVTNYVEEPNSYNYGLDTLLFVDIKSEVGKKVFNEIIKRQSQLETPLIELLIKLDEGENLFRWKDEKVDIKDLRESEFEITQLTDGVPKGQIFLAVYDLRPTVYIQATLGLVTTFMICFVLGAGTMIFSKFTNDLVVLPIESMIKTVQAITKDPLKAAHDEEEKLLLEELAQKREYEEG